MYIVYKLGNERNFWCIGMEKIKDILTSDTNEIANVLAILEFDDFDIELTDRGFSDGKRNYDYFCCKKINNEWHSFDLISFGNKRPYEFLNEEELKEDMSTQLKTFLKKYNM